MSRDALDPASTSPVQAVERYASLFTHHPHAAYSVDPGGYYTAANARALAMTGLSLEEMRRTHFSQVIHPDDRGTMQDGFERALAGDPQVVDVRVVRLDGQVVDVRCTAIPVVVDDEVVGVHGITEDVTEARRLVRELEEANAAKTLFLATVSHEVRTPLAALIGATDLLLHTELAPEAEHVARIVHRSGERLLHLAGEILEFSGLEAGQAVLRLEAFGLRALVEDVATWARPAAAERGLELSVTVEDAVPATVVGDARRVSQVLTNLVRNAIDFTERGSVHLGVSVPVPEDDAGARAWVEFRVTDTGVGISEEHLDWLFDPFARAPGDAVGDRQGIGLGLAICRELAKLMHARLTVRSTPGEGSTFTFGVPLGRAPEEPQPS